MRNTKKIGDVSEAKLLAALLAKDYVVLQPFGDNERYDLVIEKDSRFFRVQCRTGRLSKLGTILVSTRSISSNGDRVRHYGEDEIDYFGVYCPELDKCFLVSMSVLGSHRCTFTLRVSPRKFNGGKPFRFAKDFEL